MKKENNLKEFKTSETKEKDYSFETFIERSTAFWWPISIIIAISTIIYQLSKIF